MADDRQIASHSFDRPDRALRSVSRRLSVVAMCGVVAAAALCLAGCGNSRSLLAEQLPRAADGTVARVGSHKIDQAAYDHLFAAEAEFAGTPIPVPPHYELCVKHLGTIVSQIGIKARPSSILRTKCRERYEELQAKTLDRLLASNWILGTAIELGLSASDAQVQAKLAEAKRERFHDAAQFKRWLAKTGMTSGELESQARTALLSEMVRRAIVEKLGPITRSKVQAYYEAHPEIDSTLGTWDLEIVAFELPQPAAQAKREIASGRSFSEVAAELGSRQPVHSKDGHDPTYGSIGHYAEPALDKAIVTARPKTLEGPLKIEFGGIFNWFVFRVAKVHPPVQKPFAAVPASLTKALPARMQREALNAFRSSWAAKWAAQTSCAAGYRTPLCDRAQGDLTKASLYIPGAFQ